MLNYLENIGLFQVSIGKRTKRVKGALTNYLKFDHYISFANYIKENKSLLKKRDLDITMLCMDADYFEANKKLFIHPKHTISFENLFDECWVVTTYSKNANVRVFTFPPIYDEATAIELINVILLDYRTFNKIPKFKLEKFVPQKN
ncbi:MAG: hypothetical protein KBT36_09570 [Kurthia sp.]|nr:hypothetical protein [Candidatus Kurthia equi]